MGDLISRSAVLDIIHKEIERTQTFSEHETQINIEIEVRALPTAYNVEKVVAEIRRCSGNGYRDVDGDYVPPLIKTEYAIDIVKRGGVDERT